MKKKQDTRWAYPVMAGIIWALLCIALTGLLGVIETIFDGLFCILLCMICFSKMNSEWSKAIELSGE
jgi:uncharacterized membrane protein